MSVTRMSDVSSLHMSTLTVRRGGRVVFDGLSATITAGEMLVLRGPNGSGKSTLIRTLAGFIPALSGDISFGDTPISDDPSLPRQHVALSGHLNGMKAAMTLRANLGHYQAFTGGNGDIEAAAKAFHLDALLDDELRYFSQGQQHRAGLAKLLVSGRSVWLMDEPTVGLDAKNRESLKSVMQTHLNAGGIIIAATHEDLGIEGKTLDLSDFQPSTSQDPWLDEEVA